MLRISVYEAVKPVDMRLHWSNYSNCTAIWRSLSAVALALITWAIFAAAPVFAQAFTFTQTDIGTGLSPAGTQSYNSGTLTYTVNGGGSIIGGTADNCTFSSLKQAGNIEFTAEIVTQTNTNPYAVTGVMVRQTTAAGSAMAVIGVSPKNGVNFTCRPTTGATAVTTLGPSSAATVWVRLAISGNKVGGYTSPDGHNWTLVGDSPFTLVGAYSVGMAVAGYTGNNGTTATATFTNLSIPVGVPQVSENMVLWLRSDAGVVAPDSIHVNQWLDQSGNNYLLTPSTSTKPTVLATGDNFFPAPSLQFFNSPMTIQQSGFSNFSNGLTAFIVAAPQSTGATGDFFDFGNGSAQDNISIYGSSGANYSVYQGSSPSVLTNPVFGPPFPTLYQVQCLHTPGPTKATASLTYGGATYSSSTMNNINNVNRTQNSFGSNVKSGSNLGAFVFEVIVYNMTQSPSQIANINAYLYSKYGVGSAPVLAAPIFNPPAAKYAFVSNTAPPTVTIQSTPGTITFYTIDGSAVSAASSPVYSSPIPISQGGMKIQAASALPGSTTLGPVGSALFEVSPTFSEVPTAGQQLWLSADAGVVSNGSGQVSQWYDLSGNNFSALQGATANMPVLSSVLLNQSPFITFNGTSQNFYLPSTSVNFSTGGDFFFVAQPTAFATGNRFFAFGSSSSGTTNDIIMLMSGTTGSLEFGSSASHFTASSVLTGNIFQAIEGQQSGAATGSIFVNGISQGSGTPANFTNITRPYNYIGSDTTGGAHWYPGSIAEIIAYNQPVTANQSQYIWSYFANKYSLHQTATPPVSFVPASGSHLPTVGVSQAAIIVPQGVTGYFTTNGSTPTIASPVYQNGPITATSTGTLTVKVLPVLGGYPAGAVQTATYTTP